MDTRKIDGSLYRGMVAAGALNLRRHVTEINDLNVFPIPDGDTGDNMLLTVEGGANAPENGDLSSVARDVADRMLLSARGNSGVILSQFFDGIAAGLEGASDADPACFAAALLVGVKHAYGAVMQPTEGTILTVAREASQAAADSKAATAEELLDAFLSEADRSLERTPDLLPVLKEAGVVDSGGAGLIRIAEGMRAALDGDLSEGDFAIPDREKRADAPDFSRFTEDSVLEFGYCTELLLRLMRAKTDPETFDLAPIVSYLESIGNSVVAVKTGTVVKIHVHTMTPQLVLAFCQQYGEFLTVKIENMSLQHNSLDGKTPAGKTERKPFGVVAVACGEGLISMFRSLGADEVVNGGQSMNPSAQDFIDAFDRVNADVIFVLPNNGNVILTAQQAAQMYAKSDVRVLPSKSVGEGHSALTMMTPDTDDFDGMERDMTDAMEGVVTAGVSVCSRDAENNNRILYKGEYIGFIGDRVFSADNDSLDAARALVDEIDFGDHEICILISGEDADPEEEEEIAGYIRLSHPGCELYEVEGGQAVYRYLLIVE
ncbi:MAG: DAK2 domain-containing protein [Clostridia bacterium]|nr:DAK2 domain-containing protein [Clostridia bacterium]